MLDNIVILQGDSLDDSFVLNKLNNSIKSPDCHIKAIAPIYLVNALDLLSLDIDQLEQLLKAKRITIGQSSHQLFLAPRVGTISPWSSKATDILQNCGFESVVRIEKAQLFTFNKLPDCFTDLGQDWYDKMIEGIYENHDDLLSLFSENKPKQDDALSVINQPNALMEIDQKLGLAISTSEKEYLLSSYKKINKEPTVTELMMFAQANSEHCRHKIFNAQWTIDDVQQPKSLFSMIRNTEANTPKPAISAYKDNSAVFHGGETVRWLIGENNLYQASKNNADILIKVETHNHPTAISPFPGAATGSGGEIRDEAATGQGARPKAGLCGFSVSHLKIPGHHQPWEAETIGKPDRISSSLEIMLEAPIGSAAFNNEFGRPNICGYFRSMEINTEDQGWRGYHKPIMLAGGMGTVNRALAVKNDTCVDDKLVVLGGPAMLIGLGGGAASSMTSGSSCEDLDFASVQRGNPEMERRCQEVIDTCWAQEADSPIRSIHDVGAGGLSNAMPELLDDAGLGGIFDLRALKIDTKSMTPMEIWCNESQERYVISIKPEKLAEFKEICERERCPYVVLGTATQEKQLVVQDSYFNNNPVDIPMDLLFGNTPKTLKNINRTRPQLSPFDSSKINIEEAAEKILNFPTVASKKYLITIGDRTVSGLVHRDQMVGPWQVPVADCGVTIRDYFSDAGEVMGIGEKAPLALIDGAASARMAVCEAIMNIAANDIGPIENLKLSANWMAASGKGREDEVLFDAVKAIGEELCPQLGIGIPVGKDSLSMNTQWDEGKKQVMAPMSLMISAFANIQNVKNSITPYFDRQNVHEIYYVDLALGEKRLGASSLLQIYSKLGDTVPDVVDVNMIKQFWSLMQEMISQNILSAYHDISDGGLFVAITEMLIASQIGAEISLNIDHHSSAAVMFSEELGAIIAVEKKRTEDFNGIISKYSLSSHVHKIGESNRYSSADASKVEFKHNDSAVYQNNIIDLQRLWSQTSHLMASLRDNKESCQQEYDLIGKDNTGLTPKVDFEFDESVIAPYLNLNRPKVAILREQGVNGQKEMAMAFHKSGFDSYDVHMQDLMNGTFNLMEFQGLAACGGFSYGDVLGAGKGWANSILFHERLKQQFMEYFADKNKFTLGVCNGCQMLSSLKSIIPGTESWPQFLRNHSHQFEARFSSLRIEKTNSIFFADMQGAEIPVAIAHGEGRAFFNNVDMAQSSNIVASYIDNNGEKTQRYPLNPNGSQLAAAGVANTNGNVMIMMPHPERVFRSVQMSWSPKGWGENSPWMRMFYNARRFVK